MDSETLASVALVIAALGGFMSALTGTLNVLLARRAAAVQKENTKETGKIHALVNGSTLSVLRTSMIQAKQLAELHDNQEYWILAEEAKALYEEHERKQSIVDNRAARADESGV